VYCTDNSELRIVKMSDWLKTKETMHEFTALYTSAHIGQVEHYHCTLMNKAKTM
ncbi:uncharacterized protein BT62DRAFT_906148, partial [Guyanagaster necrorhizus]